MVQKDQNTIEIKTKKNSYPFYRFDDRFLSTIKAYFKLQRR